MGKLSTVLTVTDLAAAVSDWTDILGVAPTFVDANRWAQFDLDGSRLALAGADRPAVPAGVMSKVENVHSERARLTAAGLTPGPIQAGLHEQRFTLDAPGGAIVFYQPL
ncbi:hypothetical protein [Brevundimonas sp.]|uniref:hypothetical protein n=1 Tax=Brevundimonas sp. TaxID=1871086 RepID=UPI003D0A083C